MIPRVQTAPCALLVAAALGYLTCYVDAQALNDPITQYIEGRLGNRRIFWCPSGYGYLAYCPQPTDWDNYNWCCTWPYMVSGHPCGLVEAVVLPVRHSRRAPLLRSSSARSFSLDVMLIFLSCWCCFCCPLYKQLYEYDDEEEIQGPPPQR
ncbi:hypothetical protein M3Y99_00805500 [Aphelenchoides fujianensis]|nr:hypothetical protein M3Y99_00805500 [Aphelenchoides fujianensis]